MKTYFTRPDTPKNKGTAENRIGVIRKFFPEKSDLREVSNKRSGKIIKLQTNEKIQL
jgi:IS30 family transposase